MARKIRGLGIGAGTSLVSWCNLILLNASVRSSPGLGFSLQEALPPPTRVRTQVVRQLTTHLLHGTQRLSLLYKRDRERKRIQLFVCCVVRC